MNQINSIYATVSRGQVHIAADTKYIGSVDSYNNCFTQFFAWLFNWSMAVHFDGRAYSLDKVSYNSLISSLNVNGVSQYGIFRQIAENCKLPTNNLKMRDIISSEDRQSLFEKLAIAISNGDTTKALLMIGKGAELDKAYYERQGMWPSFGSDTADLSVKKRSFHVFKGTPILQAARKGNEAICKFLQEAGAISSLPGQGYVFTREITDVRRSHELIGTHLEERTTTYYLDSRTPAKSYKLGQDQCSLVEV